MQDRKAEILPLIKDSVAEEKILSFKTYYLSDFGEFALHAICTEILKRYGREDLLDMVYTAAKELVLNATKANLKRVIFDDLSVDPHSHVQYEQAMIRFKENLNEVGMQKYKHEFVKRGYWVIATFYYKPTVLNIKVKNSFTLLPVEEERIRQKFKVARSFSNLLDFYAEYGDETEGAGLGLTMVGILLDETGIDKRSFTLYSNEFNETAAKLEIPLDEKYIPKRVRFEQELETNDISREELRELFANRSYF